MVELIAIGAALAAAPVIATYWHPLDQDERRAEILAWVMLLGGVLLVGAGLRGMI